MRIGNCTSGCAAMLEDLRERLEQVSKAAPQPRHLDLRDRLSALEAGIGVEPIIKSADLIALLRDILSAKSKEELDRFLARAREMLEGANLLTDLRIPRVDLVQNPANMRPFLVTKSNPVTGEEDIWLYEPDDAVPDWAVSG